MDGFLLIYTLSKIPPITTYPSQTIMDGIDQTHEPFTYLLTFHCGSVLSLIIPQKQQDINENL